MTLSDRSPNGRIGAQNGIRVVAAPARLLMRARRKDGASAEVELSIGMVHGVDGHLTHWVLAFADRSDIARMQEELRVLRAIAAAP